MDDGQKTPPGHPDFNSYVKIYVLCYSGQMDGQTETLIRVGFPHFIPPGNFYLLLISISICSTLSSTPAARGLEELVSTVLERFLQPIHTMPVYCKN